MIKNFLTITFRHLRRNKLFSIINILGLSLGVGSTLYITLYLQNELSYDKFHQDSERIYRVVQEQNQAGDLYQVARMPSASFQLLRSNYPEVEIISAIYRTHNASVSLGQQTFVEQNIYYVDREFFNLFSFKFQKGSVEDFHDNESIALTEQMAVKYFGETAPIGKVLYYRGVPLKVAGIIKAPIDNSHLEFDFLVSFKYLESRVDMNRWGNNDFYVYTKLYPDVSVEDFEGKVADDVDWNMGRTYLQPLTDIYLRSDFDFQTDTTKHGSHKTVELVVIIGAMILLIACINFINLSTSIALKRSKEIGVRKTVGASFETLVWQFLMESIIMAQIASVLALTGLQLAASMLNNILQTEISFYLFDLNTILLATLVAVVIGVLGGLYPAFYMARLKAISSIKNEINKKQTGKELWLRNGLVIVQFSLSIGLIIGVMVVDRQLNFLTEKEIGFDKNSTAFIELTGEARENPELLKNEISKIPSVNFASISDLVPIDMEGSTSNWDWEGRNPSLEDFLISFIPTDPSFISTYGMELLQGENFVEMPDQSESTYYIINETAQKRMKLEDPLGKRLNHGIIVGVLKDFNFVSLEREIEPLVLIYSESQEINRYISLNFRMDNIASTLNQIEALHRSLNPRGALLLSFVDDSIERLYQQELRFKKLMNLFMALALFIACSGLFALASFKAIQKTKEIGIRRVLGASITHIFTLLTSEFFRLIVWSGALAVLISYPLLKGWLADYAYAVGLKSSMFLVPCCLALFLAVCIVSFHTIRSARRNPVESLRYE